MDNQAKLQAFFSAENNRDWEAYRAFIHDGITWECHSSGQTKTICGANEYIDYIKIFYEKHDNWFDVEQLYASPDGTRIVAILRNNLGEKACDIFDFEDGLIIREFEYTLD
ncbi:MAG: nuclear transport factor 2 family protein [Clostridium sp.]|jgi:hypothetical protein|nr:nuclear transport factor 2 family protein [Clostridium sp.]